MHENVFIDNNDQMLLNDFITVMQEYNKFGDNL
jgi:hypothetical protein